MSHRLLVKDRVGQRELLLLDRIVVGRDPQCDISDVDAQLSRRHAEFSISNGVVVVRDLNSRNGMLVNGKKVLEAVLHPGDVVQVATLAVTFVTATAEPEVVSAPSPATPRPVPPDWARTTRGPDDLRPILPFRPAEEDDRTTSMSPDEVARAARASVSDRRDSVAERDRPTAAAEPDPATVPAGSARATASRDPAWLQAPQALPTPAAATPVDEDQPALAPETRRPITPVTDAGWTASVTWQVATLAIVSFLIGTLSALPWRVGRLSAPLAAAMVLLLPLVALLASLALGLLVAARLRRLTLSRLGACAEQVRQAAKGDLTRVADPLGTPASAELAGAINDVLGRARRL